jgi:hypothetical protein
VNDTRDRHLTRISNLDRVGHVRTIAPGRRQAPDGKPGSAAAASADQVAHDGARVRGHCCRRPAGPLACQHCPVRCEPLRAGQVSVWPRTYPHTFIRTHANRYTHVYTHTLTRTGTHRARIGRSMHTARSADSNNPEAAPEPQLTPLQQLPGLVRDLDPSLPSSTGRSH